MRYPQDFPLEKRARVEAEKIRAGRDFDSVKQAARWTRDVEAHLRDYILRTFLAFANEVRALRLWPVDEMDSQCREFLRLLTIDAYYEKGYDQTGGRLREMTSNWNGVILPEVEREFEKTTKWRQYQDALLEVAAAQSANGGKDTASDKPINKRQSFVSPLLDTKGWSILEWATESKVDSNTARNYLKGKTQPYQSTRKRLAESLGVSVDDLPS